MQQTKVERPGGQPARQDRPRDQNQPTMTTIIQREVEDFGQQPVRRARVVGRLIFLQAALLLMIAPITIWPTPQPAPLPVAPIIVVAGFLIYGFAWIRNIAGRMNQARVILIAGSGVITLANMAWQIAWQVMWRGGQTGSITPSAQIVAVGLSSLPFLLTILEAGLLFLPEIATITAISTCGATVIGLLVTLVLSSPSADNNTYQIYLVAVIALGLQALVGIVAWQISYFIMDYSTELAQVRREEFISTQYDALRRSLDDQANRLREQIVSIINTIVSLTSRDYTARATLPDGSELKPIADTLNLLASQLSTVAESDQAQVNIMNDAAAITDIASQIAQGEIVPGSMSQPAMPSTATGSLLQSAVVALQKARNSMQNRLLQVRDLSFDAGQRLAQAEHYSVAVETHISEDQRRMIGELRSDAERLNATAVRLNQLLDEALRALSGLLPPEVSSQARIAPHDTHGAAALQQIMPGVTIQLEAITDDTELGTEDLGLKPATPAPPDVGAGMSPAPSDPNAQVRLRETWSKLVEMTEEVAKAVRDAQMMQDKLGVTSKSLRNVDNELTQLRLTVAVVRQLAEQLFRTASSTTFSIATPVPDVAPPSGPRPQFNAPDLIDRSNMTPPGTPIPPTTPPGEER